MGGVVGVDVSGVVVGGGVSSVSGVVGGASMGGGASSIEEASLSGGRVETISELSIWGGERVSLPFLHATRVADIVRVRAKTMADFTFFIITS